VPRQPSQEVPTHLEWKDHPEESKFERLSPSRKRLLDTVKMIAYRAETANPRTNRAIEHLIDELNAASVTYPGTKLRLVYRLVDAASSGWNCVS